VGGSREESCGGRSLRMTAKNNWKSGKSKSWGMRIAQDKEEMYEAVKGQLKKGPGGHKTKHNRRRGPGRK